VANPALPDANQQSNAGTSNPYLRLKALQANKLMLWKINSASTD